MRNPFQCREVNFKQVAGCKSETAINALLTEPEVKMTGYWPSSFLPFLRSETILRSIKTRKKNEAIE